MIFAARAINPGADYVTLDLSMKSLIPEFNVKYFTSLSILVFAVGGCEKISPYVNKVKDPSKGFPKAMITLAIMVVVCAILGTIAMGMMFDPAVINGSVLTGLSKNLVNTTESAIRFWSSMRSAMQSASFQHSLSVSTRLFVCFLTMRTPRSSFLQLF